MTEPTENSSATPAPADVVAHIIVFTVVVAFLGLVAFLSRMMAAGCGEAGRHCEFGVIGIAQNPLIFVVPALWALTLAWVALRAIGGRPVGRTLFVGGVVIGLYAMGAIALTALGSYVL